MNECMYCGKPLINGQCKCWDKPIIDTTQPQTYNLPNIINEIKKDFEETKKLTANSSPVEIKTDIATTLTLVTNYLIALYYHYPYIYQVLITALDAIREKLVEKSK